MSTLRRTGTWHWCLLAVILAIGLALRLIYLLNIYPFVDEYNSMLAAKMILAKGIPLMPSGLFYNHGILFSYVGALFAGIFGFSPEILRLPSLLLSLPTMLLLFYVGRRWFSPRVGLMAALLLALSPEAIMWGGRARMYALWQFLTLAAIFFLYEGIVRSPSTRGRCLGIAAFAGAALCHMRAVILLPPLVVGLILAHLLTRRLDPPIPRQRRVPWPELATAAAGLLLLLAAQRLDRPGGVASSIELQVESLFNPVRLIVDIVLGAQQFLIPPYLILTTLAIIGLLALLLRLFRRQAGSDDPMLVFLHLIVIGTVIEFSLISPPIIRVPRYTYDLLPPFFLIVTREVDFLFDLVATRLQSPLQTIVRWLPVALLAILFAGPARSAVTTQHHAASLALDVARDRWVPGDELATHLTSTAEIVLERCDHFVAIENPFLYERPDGSLTDPFWVYPGSEPKLT